MKFHEIGKRFKLNFDNKFYVVVACESEKIETRGVIFRKTCDGCMFQQKYYDYSCGYGVLRSKCIAAEPNCMAYDRIDNKNVIYKKIGVVKD